MLGPILFTMYTAPLEDLIKSYNLSCMMYADDTQIYITVNPNQLEESCNQLHKCIDQVRQWMMNNMLKLNDDKTEVIHLTSRFRPSTSVKFIPVGESNIIPSDHVRNIGVQMDKHLTMKKHLNCTCSNASQALRNIGNIRRYLDQQSTERLVHAYVTSRLDYCNSLLTGMSSSDIARLQRLQNSAARLVTLSRKHEHITPVLHSLHWLPVNKRISFKVLLLTYKSLHGQAPAYISELLQVYRPTHQLRSSSHELLMIPSSHTQFYGTRAFSVAAPKLWNLLPKNIRDSPTIETFKSRLKTHLFREAYS